MNALYQEYTDHLRKVAHLKNTIHALDIDSLLSLGDSGHEIRAEQMGLISELIHNLLTNDSYVALLMSLEKSELDTMEKKNVQISIRDLMQTKKLPTSFVKEFQITKSVAEEQYRRAKKEKDFSIFAPHLEKLVTMKQREIEFIGMSTTAYDVLLDQFDPGLTEAYLDPVFQRVKTEILPLLKKIHSLNRDIPPFLPTSMSATKNRQLFHAILDDMGYDRTRGPIIEAPVNFMIDGNPMDTRIFYRDRGKDFLDVFRSIMHEWWHGLYEQSFRTEFLWLPISDSANYMIHESQSRLYENHIGRSFEYLSHLFWLLQEVYPEDMEGITPEELYRRANGIRKALHRIWSDEISYHLHIIIRYELERDLINGKISVAELPTLWNAKSQEYLGIEVPDDAEWILQDIHWSSGDFGYFPTYSLGTFYSAQFFRQMEQEIPDLQEKISRGKLLEVKTWLNEKVHVHGRHLTSPEILLSATGHDIDINHFLSYIREKYSKIYGIEL